MLGDVGIGCMIVQEGREGVGKIRGSLRVYAEIREIREIRVREEQRV